MKDFDNALLNASRRPVSRHIGDLAEVNTVIPGIFLLVNVLHGGIRNVGEDEIHKLLLLIILLRGADVEDVVADALRGHSSTAITTRAASRTWT